MVCQNTLSACYAMHVWNSPKVAFWNFSPWRLRISRLSVRQMQRRVGFVLKPYLVGYFFCSNRVFYILVSPRGYFLAIVRHTESFPPAYPSSRWSYSCFEQQPLHLRVFCAFRKFSKQGWYVVCKGLSYIFVHLSLPLYSVWYPGPVRLCKVPGQSYSLKPVTYSKRNILGYNLKCSLFCFYLCGS